MMNFGIHQSPNKKRDFYHILYISIFIKLKLHNIVSIIVIMYDNINIIVDIIIKYSYIIITILQSHCHNYST